MFVTVNNQRVFFSDQGQGDAILLLHGWGAHSGLFAATTAFLAAHMRVLALDLPGFGQSPEPPCAWDVDAYADLVLGFLQAMQVQSCVLLGHSFGGRVILKLAARQLPTPQFPQLILVDSAGIRPAQSPQAKCRQRMYQLGRKLLRPFPRLSERWRLRHGSADYRAASPRMREVLKRTVNEDLAPCLPRVLPPTLLIWGSADTATPLADGQRMEREIPNAGLAVLQGAGHYSFLEQPQRFLRILDSFLHLTQKE